MAWSPWLNSKTLETAQTKLCLYETHESEMEQMAHDEVYLQHHRGSLGSRHLRVLTSGNHGMPADAPDAEKYQKEITKARLSLLALSNDSRQTFGHTSSEYIQFDDPRVVMDAIRDVYDRSKAAASIN